MTKDMSVDTCYQALAARFFVTGGAVNLSGKKQAWNQLGFQSGFELNRIKVIVLYSIARTENMDLFKTGDFF